VSVCVLCERIAKIAVRTVDRGCTEAEAEAARIKLAELREEHDPEMCPSAKRSAIPDDILDDLLRKCQERERDYERQRAERARQKAEAAERARDARAKWTVAEWAEAARIRRFPEEVGMDAEACDIWVTEQVIEWARRKAEAAERTKAARAKWTGAEWAEAARIRRFAEEAGMDPEHCDEWVTSRVTEWARQQADRARYQAKQAEESADWGRKAAKAEARRARRKKKGEKPETFEDMLKRWAKEAKRNHRTGDAARANRAAEFTWGWERAAGGSETKTSDGVVYMVKRRGGHWHASRDGQPLARTFRTSIEARTALFEVFEQEPATAG
jgi:hypothetical protein